MFLKGFVSNEMRPIALCKDTTGSSSLAQLQSTHSFMSEIFEARDVQYDLRNKNSLGIPNARTTSYGIETVRYLGQKLWQTLPHRIRESQSLTAFKKDLRTHNIGCDCRLCRTFISGLGFI